MFKRQLGKKILKVTIFFAMLTTFSGACKATGKDDTRTNETGKVKNIIFLIGDGMGVSYSTGFRYFKDNPKTREMDATLFDQYLVGQQSTYPNDSRYNVTDSAASATAMATGVKTYNAAIAVGNDQKELKTVLEAAKEVGKATGLVVTAPIPHATPAAFGAHDPNRNNMKGIADDYFDEKINGKHKIDVLLGGGSELLIRKDRNLVEEFKRDGYSYVTTVEEMKKDTSRQVVGLFAKAGMPKMLDRPDSVPSLADMTVSAIERLNKQKDGFFLMVEGSQIDKAGHDNDIVAAMSEMEDFERAFKVALDFAKRDGETLVIATADHSTGGFTIGSNGQYNWFSSVVKEIKRTPDFMAEQIAKGADVRATLAKYINLPLTEQEIQTVQAAARTGKQKNIDNSIEQIINTRSLTGWTTRGHTGEDVNVYAYGPESQRLAGKIDNTDQAKIIFELFKR
nr:alkaline phosphatase [Neobacillus sp. Marseille-Q6967]